MRKHKDIEYAVNDIGGGQKTFRDLSEACAYAVLQSMQMGGKYTNLDILVYSESGARALEGESGVEEYREDPDASVFKRIAIKADDQGRVA